jgi:hypothetical protein
MSSIKDKPEYIFNSLTPSTLILNQLCSGKKSGMLSPSEIELLRKSKKEISAACQNYIKSQHLKSKPKA